MDAEGGKGGTSSRTTCATETRRSRPSISLPSVPRMAASTSSSASGVVSVHCELAACHGLW